MSKFTLIIVADEHLKRKIHDFIEDVSSDPEYIDKILDKIKVGENE